MRGTHGWGEITTDEKRAIIDAIVSGTTPRGPLHLEIDLTDRCNVDCYFCNQMDVRTKEQIPYPRITEILDDACRNGLKSVRFAGGGDPLFHREIEAVIDAVHERGLVIDNITTNGLGLTAAVADRLVAGRTRELLLSLNAADAADYARMMQVKPAIFDTIVANIDYLMTVRGDLPQPHLVVQFLLDRANFHRVMDMYALGLRLRADTIVIQTVIEIENDRIDPSVLLGPADAEALAPHLREVIAADRDRRLLQICFPFPELNALVDSISREIGCEVNPGFTTAKSFVEKNGFCFFGYYSAVVRGNGDLYPCCMLMKPGYRPLGNAMKGGFIDDYWRGPAFRQLRSEMREVLLAGGAAEYQEGKFATLAPECVNTHACGLKNIYFRGDDDFYRELGEALEKARRREIRWIGNRQQLARALQRAKHEHPRLKLSYEALAARFPRMRAWLKRNLSVRA